MALPDVPTLNREKPLVFSGPDGDSRGLAVADVTPSRRGGKADAGDLKSPGTSDVSRDSTMPYLSIGNCLALPLPYGPVELTPDLAALVAAWPTLPEPIKAGIVAMVRAASGSRGGR